ncbi:discoidin domain-containing protein [Nonomuraea sp. NPDC003804]|uniref:discoidin domain-containing protein n=1 Tax=Nonomuraea sp. NPDC003804 TaxID=3154547 RepID=UPI0033A4605E
MSESSHTDVYPAANADEGNQATYGESADNAFPQWIQVDLGSPVSVDQVVLKLPNGWPSRTRTRDGFRRDGAVACRAGGVEIPVCARSPRPPT